jgi:hypothetical protein
MMRLLREIFDDRLTKGAGIILVLIIALVIFNTFSDIPSRFPLLGMFSFSLEPVLFVVGGVIFVLAIRRV